MSNAGLSFVGFLLIFAAIGALATFKRQHNTTDYLLAGRNVAPWLAALSAVATNNSGYMFIGMIGLTYTTGLSSIWLMLGWITGDLLASLLIMKKLRHIAELRQAHSFGGLLADWHPDVARHVLRRVTGVLTILFLGAYAAAQFTAGSKALHVLFDWDLSTGAILGAVLVLLYSYSGGIRASIWTDAAQSFVMLGAMVVLVVMAMTSLGQPTDVLSQLYAVSPIYMHWFPDTTWWGGALFVLGWVFAGFGVAGQPHVVIRYMALDDVRNIGRFRLWYYSWFTVFYAATIMVGLLARLILPDAGSFDAELALPMMAQHLLPEVWVGLILAGLFAATMSTADSLVLSCSASLTRDIIPDHKGSYMQTKLATAGMVLLALALSISGNQSVFALVLIAWGLLASAFVPLLVLYALGYKASENTALIVMGSGVATFFLWRFFELSALVYEIMPAMITGVAVFFLMPHQARHKEKLSSK